MAIIGIDHVQIACPAGGEDKARTFYAGLLGMTEVPKPANLSPSGCWFTGGAVNLHIGVDPDFRAATKAHPALLVDDLAGLRGRLAAAGCVIREDKPVEGYARFFTEDPFGNRIELMERV
ncbi:VOC family protein [Porphyrobacter sp. AAP60]|uniref:VOC family protein n=1 Tax=Porphyrobacter sp. AAP60 TaxID=1523423 RepID=UPI0006B9463B|nr:VOC family protein [Porphyrobacter sp. AAP60]KPF65602.1 glyoxalase [Porphyrobacter sp. AAP60]